MELIGSYHASGYTVEAYFPESGAPDVWTIWIVKDGQVVEACTARIAVNCVYGVDDQTMARLDAIATAAVTKVMRGEARSRCTVARRSLAVAA
ncbi:hypothetical protein [Dokdonella soli]|uniref:Uncharacterized protein n=1 Tax=Dokdonella soli TaxID=529810 RepID=A0ABN1IQM4_9GAMM